MKTSGVGVTVLLVVGLFSSLDARAFYNPQAGRWLSRDPIGEAGGENLFCFVKNSPTDLADFRGQYIVNTEKKLVFVSPCEIVVLYGHSIGEGNYTWNFTKGACNAGTAVLCWPVSNAQGIPAEKNLWTRWGGAPLADDLVSWGNDPYGPDWIQLFPNATRYINANKALTIASMRAWKTASEICTRCCRCEKVHVVYVELDRRNRRIDPPGNYQGAPAMQEAWFPCDLVR
jgi:hypothetical protein